MGFEEIVNWILDQIPSSNLKSEDEDQVFQQVHALAFFPKSPTQTQNFMIPPRCCVNRS